jgi:hypothetical protein
MCILRVTHAPPGECPASSADHLPPGRPRPFLRGSKISPRGAGGSHIRAVEVSASFCFGRRQQSSSSRLRLARRGPESSDSRNRAAPGPRRRGPGSFRRRRWRILGPLRFGRRRGKVRGRRMPEWNPRQRRRHARPERRRLRPGSIGNHRVGGTLRSERRPGARTLPRGLRLHLPLQHLQHDRARTVHHLTSAATRTSNMPT